MEVENRHFFRECYRSDGLWFVWVYMIGSREECEDYIFTVKVTSEDRKLEYQDCCIPLDVAKEDMLQAGSCLIFPDSTAKRLVANERIRFEVHIERKSKMAAKSNQVEKSKSGSSVQGEGGPTSEEDDTAAAASNEEENEKSPTRASSSVAPSSTTKSEEQCSQKRRLEGQPSTSPDGTTSSSSHHSPASRRRRRR